MWGCLPRVASEFEGEMRAAASSAGGADAGSGEWVCTLLCKGPDRQPLLKTDHFFVTTDGCYSGHRFGRGTSAVPTLKGGGSVATGLGISSYAFDGVLRHDLTAASAAPRQPPPAESRGTYTV